MLALVTLDTAASIDEDAAAGLSDEETRHSSSRERELTGTVGKSTKIAVLGVGAHSSY